MTYHKTIEYKITPTDAYKIIRYCGGCNKKTTYVSTGSFRVNANGKHIDVWLIYQCEQCKHTYNLAIHERVKVTALDKVSLKRFTENDGKMAYGYGVDKTIFDKNQAVIDVAQLGYAIEVVSEAGVEPQPFLLGATESGLPVSYGLTIKNPSGLKLRTDKILSEILGKSRSQIKAMVKDSLIQYEGNHIGLATQILIADSKVLGNR